MAVYPRLTRVCLFFFFFQPPNVSTGLCTIPVVQDVPRPVTTGMRSVHAISHALQAATVQQTWSFTREGASSQSSVLSGDLCSAFKTLKPGVLDTEVEEPMKDCSICVRILHIHTQRVYMCTYIDI